MIQKIGVWGANGFAGEEVVRILSAKQQVKVVQVSRKQPLEEIVGEIGYAILALPENESLKIVPELLGHDICVIDLSGAFRLQDVAVFEKYYKRSHPCPEYLDRAVYGLTEKNLEQIRRASLVANPGCYPTAVELALLPLVEHGLIEPDTRILIEAVSGYTGGGKNAKIPDSVKPYEPWRMDRGHQHIPEIEQTLGLNGQIHFFPHVAPWPRGIEATIKFNIRRRIDIVDLYVKHYSFSAYVRIGLEAKREDVVGTNLCLIAPKISNQGEVEISVAIDNLGKGAAGQAIQNLIVINPCFGDKVYESEVF